MGHALGARQAYYQQARYDQSLQMSQDALESSNGKAPEIELLVAQSLTAVGRYKDAAQALRRFLATMPIAAKRPWRAAGSTAWPPTAKSTPTELGCRLQFPRVLPSLFGF